MQPLDEKGGRSNAFRCLECSSLTWLRPGEDRRAARPRCSSCGSILIAYEKSVRAGDAPGTTVETGPGKPSNGKVVRHLQAAKKRQKAMQTPRLDPSPEAKAARKLGWLKNHHADFKARRKHGVPIRLPKET